MNNQKKKRNQYIQRIILKTGLFPLVDFIRLAYSCIKRHRRNRKFSAQRPTFKFPPPSLAFDAYSDVNWSHYYHSGHAIAERLTTRFRAHHAERNPVILEWGCGPARIIRHIPLMIPGSRVYGTDYNEKTIHWCKKSLPEISFIKNELDPPIQLESELCDFIYVISVFTHLTENVSRRWFVELTRLLKPGGIIFFTTHGDYNAQYLLPDELREYKQKGFFERKWAKEGRKFFSAWHSAPYVQREFLHDFTLLENVPACTWPEIGAQEAWIAQKKHTISNR